MNLPNVRIVLGNGNIGATDVSTDGVAALLLTGSAVEGKFVLNKRYVLSQPSDLTRLGITKENNPLIYKEVMAFFAEAGDGAELHLLAVSEAMTLTSMVSNSDGSPIRNLLDTAAGRIRLVGINRNPPANYEATMRNGLDGDVLTAIDGAQTIAENYLSKIAPIVVLVPGLLWSGSTDNLYKPREGSQNMVSVVLASDGQIGTVYSAAIGMVLGRVAKTPVNVSIGRVADGAITAECWMTDGNTPESHFSKWDFLNDAGYIFPRTFIGKNGYYLNFDATAVATTDDYSRLSLVRVIQKAVVVCYQTYINSILDALDIDPNTGKIPTAKAKYFESLLERNINKEMSGEISGFTATIDPNQDLITTGKLSVNARVVPTALLRDIEVNLAFTNPYNEE